MGGTNRAVSVPERAYDFTFTDRGVMIIKWNRVATPEESSALMARIERLWAENRSYAAAMVTHPDINADARHRKLWSEWHVAHRAQVERYCRGMSITLDSPAIRALMTVISWFSTGGYPIKYVRTEAEAVEWAESRMRGA